jgi:hypothetical protein
MFLSEELLRDLECRRCIPALDESERADNCNPPLPQLVAFREGEDHVARLVKVVVADEELGRCINEIPVVDPPGLCRGEVIINACLSEAGIGPHRLRRVLMVVRTYPIRAGNPPTASSGQMSQETDWDVIAVRSGLDEAEFRDRRRAR